MPSWSPHEGVPATVVTQKNKHRKMLVFAIERLLLQIERCGSHFYISYLAGDEGFEPPNTGTRNQCLTTWRIPNECFIALTNCTLTEVNPQVVSVL